MNRPLVRKDAFEAPDHFGDDTRVVDVILERMAALQISVRMLAVKTGIKKSRANNILHRDRYKRHPLRLDEKAAILQVVGLTVVEACLAADIIIAPEGEPAGQGSVATMLAQLLDGLPADIVQMVEHIDGVDFSDIRPEHGLRLRALLLKFLEKHYTDIGVRRLDRTRDLDGL